MTSTVGWQIAKKLGDELLEELANTARDAEGTDAEVAAAQRQYKAGHKFWATYLQRIENAKSPNETPENQFIEVSY